eukprot:1625855-Prorocentrum_lima.AAC.1
MTSSLVGSEMCIRDRSNGRGGGVGRCEGGTVTGAACLSASVTRVVLEPVSYTHLTLPTICSV